MKRPNLEQLMYLTLLLVFLAVGFGLFVAVGFGNKLDAQVKELREISKRQAQTIEQLRSGVEEVKADNKRNTELLLIGNARLECLLGIYATGDTPAIDCPAAPQQSTAPYQSSTATPAPQPAPAPQPGKPKKGFSDFIKSIRGK